MMRVWANMVLIMLFRLLHERQRDPIGMIDVMQEATMIFVKEGLLLILRVDGIERKKSRVSGNSTTWKWRCLSNGRSKQ